MEEEVNSQASLQELESRDMQMSAIHECGHAAVCRHYQLEADPMIWRNPNGGGTETKFWIGNTKYFDYKQSPLQKRRIAIAGIIAEEIADCSDPLELDDDGLAFALGVSRGESIDDSHGWSRTDWERSEGWTENDLHAVHVILKKKWKALQKEVAQIIALAIEDDLCANE